jgi:hypothetical protein
MYGLTKLPWVIQIGMWDNLTVTMAVKHAHNFMVMLGIGVILIATI